MTHIAMNQLLRYFLPSVASALLAVSTAAQTTWHVDAGASPGGDGLSWSTAFDSLDTALLTSVAWDHIWVKAGVYRPRVRRDPTEPRSATFAIPIGVRVYGGFDGTETLLDDRAGLFDQTILSGDLGVPGDRSDNAGNVVWIYNPSGIPSHFVTIDGLTIRDGNAVGTSQAWGGGLYVWNSALFLRNCIVRDNHAMRGGAMSAEPGLVYIRWCEFINNRARTMGGAIRGRTLGGLKVSHCTFRGNYAPKGGAVYIQSITGTGWGGKTVCFTGSIFHDNQAAEGGAVMLPGSAFTSGSATFKNCTIAYNHATKSGGGVLARFGVTWPGRSTLHNCVVWNNSAPIGPNLEGRQAVSFSNVQGGLYLGGTNISADPLFVDGPNRDLRLIAGSPCNDAGSNELVPKDYADADDDEDYTEWLEIDLDWKRRIADDPLAPNPGGGTLPVVDMGAYEL